MAEFLEYANIPDKIKKILTLMLHDPAKLDWNQPVVVKLEKALILKYGVPRKFRERGPPGPEAGGPNQWRCQKWRTGSERWGNSGGKNKAWWTWFKGGGKRRGEPEPPRPESKKAKAEEEHAAAKPKSKGRQPPPWAKRRQPLTAGDAEELAAWCDEPNEWDNWWQPRKKEKTGR